ncbi:hypothetical protein BDR06DRAFT_954535 [Suillus hirtellus]|nr:hypothetical protein BDR06DRAFT_954535 [Suillus hirtellus]
MSAPYWPKITGRQCELKIHPRELYCPFQYRYKYPPQYSSGLQSVVKTYNSSPRRS